MVRGKSAANQHCTAYRIRYTRVERNAHVMRPRTPRNLNAVSEVKAPVRVLARETKVSTKVRKAASIPPDSECTDRRLYLA